MSMRRVGFLIYSGKEPTTTGSPAPISVCFEVHFQTKKLPTYWHFKKLVDNEVFEGSNLWPSCSTQFLVQY